MREEEYKRLVEEIRNCTKCRLHATRKNPVPGEGPLDADIMLVGEAPGKREDELGRPFVGRAGELLNALLGLAGLRREDVYITNVVKCRPPGNRDPREDEIAACLPYLIRQIQIIAPKVIVALGRHAGRTLYSLAGKKWPGIKRAHGRAIPARIAGVSVTLYATYHPAAALYNPELRSVLEEDFRKLPSIIGGGRRGKSLLDFF
ncbi:MAG: uracil-DNA glycosylase [Desulfurococcales archaeon]|nr:uracil-DNA glycosylase [Desulfurococcales archaeon]